MVFQFSDINSPTNDLLNDDYTDKLSLKCKKSAGPIQVTMESSRNPSNGTLSTKLGSKFNCAGIQVDKLQLTQDANGVLESTFPIFPHTSLGFVGNPKTAQLNMEYQRKNFTGSAILDVQEFQKFQTAMKVGLTSGVNLASDVHVDLLKSQMSQMNVGLNYQKGPFFASLMSVNGLCCGGDGTDKNKSNTPSANLGLIYHVNPKLTVATNATHCYKNHEFSCLTLGGLYKSTYGDLKLKANCCGVVCGALTKEVLPNVNVTASTSVNIRDVSSVKYGLGVTI